MLINICIKSRTHNCFQINLVILKMLILNQGALLWLQKLPKFLKYANISFKNKANAFRWFHNMRLSSMTSSYNKKRCIVHHDTPFVAYLAMFLF